MENYDFLCEASKLLNDLSGLPVAIFRGKEHVKDYSVVRLPPASASPALRHFETLYERNEPVAYEVADDKLLYGLVRSKEDDLSLLVGPACLSDLTEHEIAKLMLDYDIPKEQEKVFKEFLFYAPGYHFQYCIELLLFLQLVINKTLVSHREITLDKSEQGEELVQQAFREMFHHNEQLEYGEVQKHTTLEFEQKMLDCIRLGDRKALEEVFSSVPIGRIGKVAPNSMRQAQNTAIVSITLSVRAAIKGGLSQEIAFQLSDIAIQKIEACSSINEVNLISYRMMTNLTERVAAINTTSSGNPIVDSAIRYIDEHVCSKISIDDLAECAHANRSYLSAKFKKETGLSIMEYINKKKIEEAERLLRFSDKSLIAIASYLSFSSQSHFQNTFKKVTGKTPTQYQREFKITQ